MIKNLTLACVLSVLGVTANSLVAQALDFKFSLRGTNFYRLSNTHSESTVTGVIQGLKDNAYSRPTRIIINKNSLGIPEGTILVEPEDYIGGIFVVENGKVLRVRGVIYGDTSSIIPGGISGKNKYLIRLGESDYGTYRYAVVNGTNGRSMVGIESGIERSSRPPITYTTSEPEEYEGKELTEEPTKKDIDTALKKRGFPDSDYPYYERPNGCSYSPDSNWFNSGTGFKPACDNHDRCYSTVGKSKRTCDDNFKADMDRICATGTPVTGCSMSANLYYSIVNQGAWFYTTAQEEAKKYQVEVEKFKKEWRQKIGR